ncbi:hypothetical protein Tco_0874644 [Tanacetum coccineum]|uniref:MAK10-like protein n=1 Tax=Tanacetum coccineum TaxID=301880 RepID=A0ABQ5BMY9_9ASTR
MGDENPIRTLGDYSKPSHEGYRNTIELPVGTVDPSPYGRILLPDSLLNSFHREGPRTIDQSAGGKLRDLNAEESWALLEDLALYDNESWNDPRDFAKLVKAIILPQDVPSTSDRRLIKLENQVQCLMEAYLALTQPTQVNKITTSCEICSGPHDTQYCMEDPEQAFVEYASSRTDEAGEGLVSDFMASQDARLSKFEADFKQQQSEMTNKIDTVLKAITDRIAGTLPSDTVKNPKLGTHPVSSARSYPTMDPQCSTQIHSSINTITIHPKQQSDSRDDKTEKNEEEKRNNLENHSDSSTPPDPSIAFITEKVLKFNSLFESLGLIPLSPNAELFCTKDEDGDVMFIQIIPRDDNSHKEEPEPRVQEVEYFDIFPTRSELAYHKYLICGPIPSIFLRNPIIIEGSSLNLKIPCNIGHVHVKKAYINLNSPVNIMTRMMYNWIMRRKLNPREDANGGISNFIGRIKGMHVFIGNFTYIVDFRIVEDISSIVDPRLSQVVLGRPFVGISNMSHDPPKGVVRFINGTDEVAYKMPHKIEQYDSPSDLEKEHTKSVYLRNEKDKKRGVEYVMSKILGFYKECLELGPEYLRGIDDEGEVTKAHLLEDKQIPSVGVFDEVFRIWKTFGRITRDLDHLEKKRTRLRTYTNITQDNILISLIMEYLVNISKRRAFWSLNEDILKINNSDYQYAVSIKKDMAYPCLHLPKTLKETSSIRRIQRRPISRIEDIVCEDSERYQAWSLLQESPIRRIQYLDMPMTKVIKREFEKLEDLIVEVVLLTCDTSLKVFNNEFNRLSRMDDDLFTYKVEVANILCDSNMDDDSEHESDDDMGYDPSDIRGNDKVELTDEESSNNEDDVAEVFRIDTNIFDYETPLCLAFNKFNYLLKVDPDLRTKDIMGFKTYEEYKDDWIYEWNKNVKMDDPNITMEEYIRLEEEKARKRGKVFNWETAKFGKIWYDEDLHDLRSVETEFPAISFNDEVSSEKTLSCEPTQKARILELNQRYFEDYYSDYQYAVSIKEDTAYPCLYSPKTTKETSSIHHIQRNPIQRIQDIVSKDSGRYQTWSLLQETPIRRIQSLGYAPWLDNGIWKEPTPVKHHCKPFNYKTGCSEWPTCSWREDGYCNGENLPVLALLETHSITKTLNEDDDDESRYEQRRRWNVYTNYDDAYEINQYVVEREELCEIHEFPVCNIRRFEMIKYSFGQDEEYVAIKEDEYDDLERTSEDACRAYQEIFRMMDEGWMITRVE